MYRVMSETGSISSSECNYLWSIHDWSQINEHEEYKSLDFYVDDLKWCLTIHKSISATKQSLHYYIKLLGKVSKPSEIVMTTVKWKTVFNDMRGGHGTQQYDFGPSKFSSNDRYTSHFFESISLDDIRYLFVDSTKFSDISFRVFEYEERSNTGNETETDVEDSNLIHAHKVVLANSSPWFNILFTNGMQESSQNKITIYGVQFNVFKRLFTYCYIYELQMKYIEAAYKVMEAADRFQFAKVCEDALLFICQKINAETIWDIWKRADKYKYEKIIIACIAYISERMIHAFSSSAFLKAEAKYIRVVFDTTITNLCAVDHTVEERDLYEAILKWVENRK
ncbi:MAG: BTB/POZ domain-containing protein [Benjaminiella poitrasii]|nr:MAG: BTB/POZ domain-containing protein [Benjaminiella poitrasii]